MKKNIYKNIKIFADGANFDEMINPRLATLAEIAWCSESKRSWKDFRSSLKYNLKNLSKMGWKFHKF